MQARGWGTNYTRKGGSPSRGGISATSYKVARAVMYAVLLNIAAPSDRAVGCSACNGGCHREMVDNWTIHELTIYELMLVVAYMFCVYVVYVLLCIFCRVRVFHGLPP